MAPATLTLDSEPGGIICASGVQSDNGITYGGIDDDGHLEPAAREMDDNIGRLLGF